MATERTLNIHKLPPCPLCDKNMVIGKSTSGPKIYCEDYAHCGGIIHNLNVVPKDTQSKSASALSGGNAEEGTLSLESRDDSKKVETSPQASLGESNSLPSPGSANFRRMQQYA